MKFKIENMSELTDSRQVMESKPNKFIPIFIGLTLTILIISFIWLWFIEKEEIIKVSGIISPIDQIQTISNEVSGTVKNINFKNGDSIKKGDIIYSLDDSNLIAQKENLIIQKESLVSTNEKFDKFINCINDNVNYFKENEEKEFYYKYKNYEIANKVSSTEQISLINSKNEINNKINEINALKKSIEENIDYTYEGSIYKEQYNNYQISKNDLEDKIKQLNQDLLEAENNDEKNIIEQIKDEIKSNETAIKKLKSDITLQINTSKNEFNNEINSINNNIKKIEENNSILKEKNKYDTLSQIEEQKSLNNSKINEIDASIKEININIEKCCVRAQINGKINITNELQLGTIVQNGFILGKIIPDSNNLQVKLIIPDKDISKLKINKAIKYNITSLPYTEFGFIDGKLKSLSVDSNIDENTGLIYYTGIGTLEKNNVISYTGNKFDIKFGMSCEAQIIIKKKKMLYYLLEKLNIQIN